MKKNKKKKAKRVCSAFLAGSLATCTAASFLPATAAADSISISPSGSAKTDTGISLGTDDSGKISYSEASERYANIEMSKTTGGKVHMSFSYDSTPMISLTNEALDGYDFVRYVITDEKGNSVSRDDLCNLNFTGKVTLGARFKKKASQEEQDVADQQRKLEEMKSRAKLIKSKTSIGGNVSVSIDYTQNPPVHLNASAYSGYKFDKYAIKDEDGKDVSLSDLENLNIVQKVYVSGVFVKTDSGSAGSKETTAVDDSQKGLSYSEALSRYNSIITPKTVTGGTFHMNFNYDNTPMITLTQSANDGYRFVDYSVTDGNGNAVSMNDFLNLNFTGNVTLTAKFEKTQTAVSDSDKEVEKAAVEKRKSAFKLLHFSDANGGNIGVSVNYENEKAVTITNSPAAGYKFKNYIIKDSDGNTVSLDDVEKLNITKETTVTPVFEKTESASDGSGASDSGTVIQKNHGLTASQALAKYNDIEMLNSKNGTYHMSFNFAGQPMITLTNTPMDGAEFKRYVITDEGGNEVSLDDFVNLQFAGKVKITAEFAKKAVDTKTDEEKQKEKYEELKAKFRLLTFERADGGNVSASFSYSSVPPVTVTATPASDYKFSKYIIKNAADENVSLDDVENLKLTSKTTVTPVFEKTGNISETNPSKPAETKNAGLTSSQALARYNNIEMLNSKNGTYHMSFNFSAHPMVTLTNSPFDGYKFSRYVITDETGREISLEDFSNLNFNGKTKITAEFVKNGQTSEGSKDNTEAEKAKYEELKNKFRNISIKTPSGGDVHMSFDYSSNPPVVVTNTPASGYTFDSYVISDAKGDSVSLKDLQSLNISGPVTLSAKFTKIKTEEEKQKEKENQPKTNHGLTLEQALARYDRMMLAKTKHGTLHAHFDFEKTPIVTLTPDADDGYVFAQYIITDENGNTVSTDDAENLQYTGSITVETVFRTKDSNTPPQPSKDSSEEEKKKYADLKKKFDMVSLSQTVGGMISGKFDYKAVPPFKVSEDAFSGYESKGYSIKDEDGNDVSLDDLQNLNITKKVKVSGIFEKKAVNESQTVSAETTNAGLTYTQALERYNSIKLPESIKGGSVHLSFDFTKTPMVTLTETPENGYVFRNFVITGENGKTIFTSDLCNLNFSGTATVSALFMKKEESDAKDAYDKEKEKYEWYKKKLNMLLFKKAVGGDLHVKFDYKATPPLSMEAQPYKGYKFKNYKLTYANGHTAKLEDVLNLDIRSKVTVLPVFEKVNAKKGTVTVSASEKSTKVDISSEKSKKNKKASAKKKTETKKNKKTAVQKAKKKTAKKTKKAVKKTAVAKRKTSPVQVLTITSSSSTGTSGRRSAPAVTVSMHGKTLTYSVRNVKASERVDLQFKKAGASSWKSATDRNLRKMTNGTYYFRARLIGRGYKTSWSSVKTITRNVPVKKHKRAKK